MPEERKEPKLEQKILGKICPIMTGPGEVFRCEEDCSSYHETYVNHHGFCAKEGATKVYQICRMWPIEQS